MSEFTKVSAERPPLLQQEYETSFLDVKNILLLQLSLALFQVDSITTSCGADLGRVSW
jgi:hypothetical protein